MKITVLFFAHLKEKAGEKQLTLDLNSGSRVSDLKNLLAARFPAMLPAMKTVLVAVNQE
jgi:molybdopterin converting factor small subunit